MNWSMHFFCCTRCKKQTRHLRIPLPCTFERVTLLIITRKVTHEDIRSFTMQGLVAEWLRATGASRSKRLLEMVA